MSEQFRYNAVAMLVHWFTALAVIGLLVVGNIMADMPGIDPVTHQPNLDRLALFNWHKSFGVTVLLLTCFRLAWRLTHRPPALPAEMPAWEIKVAHVTHWAFYALLLLVPLLGWVLVSASPRNVPTVLFGTFQWPHIPLLADLDVQVKKDYRKSFEFAHASAAYVMAGLIALHVGAALRHRFMLKDKVAQRMLPRIVPALLLLAAPPMQAAEWQVDSGKSSLGFVGSLSGKEFEGHFKSWQADISFDAADPAAGHAKVVIDMASAVTGDKQRDLALPNSDWFDAKKSPQAFFEAAGFAAKGGNVYEAKGTLTIRGIERPVALPFTLDIMGDAAHAKGGLDIVRTDYGVGQGEWSDGSSVALKVSIVFDLTARKKG
jgi:cytochrome b561